ncbi:hypothetical protein FGG78_38335, partial [Thioclava sp. BHET1]
MPSQPANMMKLSIAAQFPVGSFLENIAVRQDNSMLITLVDPQQLFYVPPPKAEQEVSPWLLYEFEESVMGIVEMEEDLFLILTTKAYTTRQNYLYRLDLRGWSPDKSVRPELVCEFPREVLALNGCCKIAPTTLLAADSLAGLIWRIDVQSGRAAESRVWLKHGSMAYIDANLPPPPQPGVNGVRFSARQGHVYYTTTGQKLFMRVAIDANTLEPCGEPEQLAAGGMYDDFC